jgi:hypothetical protein
MKIQRAAEKSDGFELNITQTEIIVLIVPCVFRKMKKKHSLNAVHSISLR